MTKNLKIDETMLHAYVDGELDSGTVAEVEAWLRENPADNARVEAWKTQARELKKAFGQIVSEPLPAELTAILNKTENNTWLHWGKQAIAASLLLAVGGFGGWQLAPNGQIETAGIEIIANQAISAHSVYSSEVRHPVEVAVNEKDHLIAWLSNRLGHKLSAPELSDAGFELIGGRLLADSGQPSAQFMYESAEGNRITLYVSASPTDQETAFKIASTDSWKSYYWLDGTFGYAITGDFKQADLLNIAKSVYDQLTIQA